MKKWFCFLMVAFLIHGGVLAEEMHTGLDGYIRLDEDFYCLERDGLYRFEGTCRQQLCTVELNVRGGLVCDGETAHALSPQGEIIRMDLQSGEVTLAEHTTADMKMDQIVAYIDGWYYLLGNFSEMSFYTLYALRDGELLPIVDGAGTAFQWGENVIVGEYTYDMDSGWLCAVSIKDQRPTVQEISATAYLAAVSSDELYYWEGVPSADKDIMEDVLLIRLSADRREVLAQAGTAQFYIRPFFGSFACLILNDSNDAAVVSLHDGSVHRVARDSRDFSAWNYWMEWLADPIAGTVFSYDSNSGTLYMECDGSNWETSAEYSCDLPANNSVARNGKNKVLDIYDGVLIYRIDEDDARLYWTM